MAVCNLFSQLSNASGNFMLFSQYVEDVTHNHTEGDNWKVIPTQFVALNIDFDNIDKNAVLNAGKDNLNVGIPKYFQNCFENGCAYGRSHVDNWNPSISRNLFWNNMFDGRFISTAKYGSDASGIKYVPEIVYYGDITMHSYNEHKGMGYSEIYCYIPTDAPKMNCQVICATDTDPEGRKCDASNNSIYLEGFTNRYVEDYSTDYYYNPDFLMSFDDQAVGSLASSSDAKYNVNTIVVLYSVFRKLNDDWIKTYSNIPMGMYIAGKFDEEDRLTNTVTKYVTTSYGTGTSYGLRICTRMTAAPNGTILHSSDLTVDDSGYANMCQLMSGMNENLAMMLDISKSAINTTQQYKDMLSIIKNNKVNVPYVKDVNGIDCWFVNGKFVAAVHAGADVSGCMQLAPETIEKRLNNLTDIDPTNDWTHIEDPNGCECDQLSNKLLAEELGLNPDDYPDYGFNGSDCPVHNDYVVADDQDVIGALNNNQ